MKKDEIWTNIHAERASLADTHEGLGPEQWSAASWCDGWSVLQITGHVVAAAEQTPLNFYKQMIQAGFRFDVFADRAATRLGRRPTDELVGRLRDRTTTTNHPPAPVMAMLGEIVVHGADIRRPLGLEHQSPEAALVAVAENYRKSNLLIGSKRRVAGLKLVATDAPWSCGDGPEITGPLASLVLAMSGRAGANDDLSGDGVATLAARQ
jgi:uncharacterized protein (TIGR03083 family)